MCECVRVCGYAIMDKNRKLGPNAKANQKAKSIFVRWAFFKSFVIVFLFSSLCFPFSVRSHSLSLIPAYCASLLPHTPSSFYLILFFSFCAITFFFFGVHYSTTCTKAKYEWSEEGKTPLNEYTIFGFILKCMASQQFFLLYPNSIHMCCSACVCARALAFPFSFKHFPLQYILLFAACVCVLFFLFAK